MQPDGFPLPKRERVALDHFIGAAAPRLGGIGPGTISNLLYRGWVRRVERAYDYGPDLYQTTDDGRLAARFDEAVVRAGFPRPLTRANPGPGAYRNLEEKYAQFVAERWVG